MRLETPLRAFLGSDARIRVIIDSRRGDRRRAGDRRAVASQRPADSERRRIHAQDGRRIGEHRASLTLLPTPTDLPAPARAHSERLTFVERHPLPARDVEDMETARLVVRLQSGDQAAFDAIYERYISRVYGYFRVALRDEHEAEDATHEVFVSVLRALPTFRIQGAPFRGWLFRIVRNHALNQLRKRGRLDVVDPADITRRIEAQAAAGGAEALDSIGDADLLRLIQVLPITQRQAIVLRYVMGFDLEEVAAILGRSPNAVSQLQRRALSTLYDRLTAAGRGPDARGSRLPMRMRLPDRLVTGNRRLALSYR